MTCCVSLFPTTTAFPAFIFHIIRGGPFRLALSAYNAVVICAEAQEQRNDKYNGDDSQVLYTSRPRAHPNRHRNMDNQDVHFIPTCFCTSAYTLFLHEVTLSDHQAGCEKIGYLPGHVSFIPLASIFSMILPQVKYFNKRPPGWQNKYDSKKNRRNSLDTTQPSLE